MLPRNGVVTDDGEWHFHMKEMAESPERMSRVPGFYRLIEKHVAVSLSCRINVGELRRATERVVVAGAYLNWAELAEPYFASFRALMDHFHARRREMERNTPELPPDAAIDFYFDEHTDKKKVRAMWDGYMGRRPPEQRRLFGNEPRFENDRRFLPLQAADLWAWWVRKWCQESRGPDAIQRLDFGGHWQGTGYPPRIHIEMNEDQWVTALAAVAADNVPPYTAIKDRKTGRLLHLAGPRIVGLTR
jgi:hypothetical protein